MMTRVLGDRWLQAFTVVTVLSATLIVAHRARGAQPFGAAEISTAQPPPPLPVRAASQRNPTEATAALARIDNDFRTRFETAARLVTKNPELSVRPGFRAMLELQSHDYAKAIESAKAGHALDPRDRMALLTLCYAELHNGDAEGALASANMLIELKMGDPMAHLLRAMAYRDLGRWKEVNEDMDRAKTFLDSPKSGTALDFK